jgi:hypothetical protein
VRDLRLRRSIPIRLEQAAGAEPTLSENAPAVTDACPAKRLVMPLWQAGSEFVSPFCCYGDDIDCDLCGAWVVFHLAALLEEGGYAAG